MTTNVTRGMAFVSAACLLTWAVCLWQDGDAPPSPRKEMNERMNTALRTLPPVQSAVIRIGLSSLNRSDDVEAELKQQLQSASGSRARRSKELSRACREVDRISFDRACKAASRLAG